MKPDKKTSVILLAIWVAAIWAISLLCKIGFLEWWFPPSAATVLLQAGVATFLILDENNQS